MYDHFLATIFTKQDFKEEELEMIISKFKRVSFSKNDLLLREGTIENNYWFIESGYARSYVVNKNGVDTTTNFYTMGDIIIDWASFFLRNPAIECIQALTNCICWQLDFNTFQQLFHGIEMFREQGRERLAHAYFDLKKHDVAMIAEPARERYLQLLKNRPHIIQHISLKYIASYLGITSSSLSRIRKTIS